MKTNRKICPHCGKKFRSNGDQPYINVCPDKKCQEKESNKYDTGNLEDWSAG